MWTFRYKGRNLSSIFTYPTRAEARKAAKKINEVLKFRHIRAVVRLK